MKATNSDIEPIVKEVVHFIETYTEDDKDKGYNFVPSTPFNRAEPALINGEEASYDLLDEINKALGGFTFGGVDYFVQSKYYRLDELEALWKKERNSPYQCSLFQASDKMWSPDEIVEHKGDVFQDISLHSPEYVVKKKMSLEDVPFLGLDPRLYHYKIVNQKACREGDYPSNTQHTAEEDAIAFFKKYHRTMWMVGTGGEKLAVVLSQLWKNYGYSREFEEVVKLYATKGHMCPMDSYIAMELIKGSVFRKGHSHAADVLTWGEDEVGGDLPQHLKTR